MAKKNWYGQSCFEISVANTKDHPAVIIIDPFDEKIGLKVPSLEGQILLMSHDHPDHSNTKAVKGNPFVIDGPGEYEIGGVFIKGIAAFHDDVQGKERGLN